MDFTKINSKVVRVDLMQSGPIIARRGAMLFYTGDVQFAPHGTPGGVGGSPGLGGLAGMAGRMMQGEHEATMIAQGKGTVHYGFKGLETHIVDMAAGGDLRVEHRGCSPIPPACRARWSRRTHHRPEEVAVD